MLKKIREFFAQKGQGVVEYALLLGFVAIIAISLLNASGLRASINDAFDNAKSVIDASRF